MNTGLWMNIFFGCFLFGFVLTIISLLVGLGHQQFGGNASGHWTAGHHGLGHGHGHFGHGHGHGAGHTHAAGGHSHGTAHAANHGDGHHHGAHHPEHLDVLGFINYNTVLMFVTWFGAAGYLLLAKRQPAVVVFSGAIGAGLGGAMIIFLFLEMFLRRGETYMDPELYHLPGTLARVTSSIRKDGTGEIVYEQGGTRKTAGARGEDGAPYNQGDQVVITRYEKGIAYVRSPTYKLHLETEVPVTSPAQKIAN